MSNDAFRVYPGVVSDHDLSQAEAVPICYDLDDALQPVCRGEDNLSKLLNEIKDIFRVKKEEQGRFWPFIIDELAKPHLHTSFKSYVGRRLTKWEKIFFCCPHQYIDWDGQFGKNDKLVVFIYKFERCVIKGQDRLEDFYHHVLGKKFDRIRLVFFEDIGEAAEMWTEELYISFEEGRQATQRQRATERGTYDINPF